MPLSAQWRHQNPLQSPARSMPQDRRKNPAGVCRGRHVMMQGMLATEDRIFSVDPVDAVDKIIENAPKIRDSGICASHLLI